MDCWGKVSAFHVSDSVVFDVFLILYCLKIADKWCVCIFESEFMKPWREKSKFLLAVDWHGCAYASGATVPRKDEGASGVAWDSHEPYTGIRVHISLRKFSANLCSWYALIVVGIVYSVNSFPPYLNSPATWNVFPWKHILNRYSRSMHHGLLSGWRCGSSSTWASQRTTTSRVCLFFCNAKPNRCRHQASVTDIQYPYPVPWEQWYAQSKCFSFFPAWCPIINM